MSASLLVIEEWHGEDVLKEVEEAIDYAIAYAAHDAVRLDKTLTPVLKGTLRNSKTAHSPDYGSGNDFQDAQAGDIFNDDVEVIKRVIVDHAIAWGSWIPYAYAVHNGTSVMPARPTTLQASDFVANDMDVYVETGFQHVRETI